MLKVEVVPREILDAAKGSGDYWRDAVSKVKCRR